MGLVGDIIAIGGGGVAGAGTVSIILNLVDNVSPKLDDAGKSISNFSKDMEKNLKNVGAVIGMAVGAIVDFSAKSVKAYSEAQAAVSDLNMALVNHGIYSKEFSADLQKQASALQNVSRFSDEQIMGLQRLEVNYGLNSKRVMELTPKILDLAIAYKDTNGHAMDLDAITKGISAAMNGNIGLLDRTLKLTIDQKNAYSNIHSEAGRYKFILDLLAKSNGAAAADSKTFEGQLVVMKNTFNDIQEKVGEQLIPTLQSLISYIVANKEVLIEWGTAIGKLIGGALKLFMIALSNVNMIISLVALKFGTAAAKIGLFRQMVAGNISWEVMKEGIKTASLYEEQQTKIIISEAQKQQSFVDSMNASQMNSDNMKNNAIPSTIEYTNKTDAATASTKNFDGSLEDLRNQMVATFGYLNQASMDFSSSQAFGEMLNAKQGVFYQSQQYDYNEELLKKQGKGGSTIKVNGQTIGVGQGGGTWGGSKSGYGQEESIRVTGYNDFMMRPGQAPISFSPQDTIIGMKNPEKLESMSGKNSGVTVNIGAVYGMNPRDISKAMQKELQNLISVSA